jgi:hypothetical protein
MFSSIFEGRQMGRLLKFSVFCLVVTAVLATNESAPKKKKDVRDFTDADIEKLYEEWEENDEEPIPVNSSELNRVAQYKIGNIYLYSPSKMYNSYLHPFTSVHSR